ncbi:leucine-rich repeat-containing protein 15-like [Photinus pyralis]|uniref:LRRCT domain-containing protein n=1 Tax=Photinus pyralis TaxID=7054 RepID=A0A1Y1KPW7_PHOPY|nr:leucine-rich repeat-containing protein 15-like [Photinus pyralis]
MHALWLVAFFAIFTNGSEEGTFKDTLLKFSIDEVGDFSLLQRVTGSVTPRIVSSQVKIVECYNQTVPIIKQGAIADMKELMTLVFTGNKINKIKFAAFLNLPKLEDMVLVNNQIRMIEIGVFGVLPSVSRINLHNNRLTFFEHGTFTNMPNLMNLIVSNNGLDSIEHQWFDIDSRLTVLELSNNLIRRIPIDAFKNTQKLEIVNLSDNKILTVDERAFEGLSTLFTLNLSNNRIYQLTGRLFKPLVALDELMLHGNNLTYIHRQILEDVSTTLKVLTIYSNPWQCACYDNIHQWAAKRAKLEIDSVIGCKIEFNPVCVIPFTNSEECLEDPDDELDYMFYSQFNVTNHC